MVLTSSILKTATRGLKEVTPICLFVSTFTRRLPASALVAKHEGKQYGRMANEKEADGPRGDRGEEATVRGAERGGGGARWVGLRRVDAQID